MDYKNYYKDREKKKALGYRLRRRTKEVIKTISKYKGRKIDSILDVGCADGKMLEMILKSLKIKHFVGIDNNQELMDLANPKIKKYLKIGDASKLNFKDNSFDVIVSTAVIEHLKYPEIFLKETHRVLKNKGIIILSTPNPFFEKLGDMIGHLKDDTHYKTFNLNELSKLLKKNKFKVIEKKRFMISPIGMPYEIQIENFLRKIGMHFTMCNQLIVGIKLKK